MKSINIKKEYIIINKKGLKDGSLRSEDFDTPFNLLNKRESVLYELYSNLSEEKKANFYNAARSKIIFDEELY